MKDKRKPGVPYIIEALNLLHTSEEKSSDDENQISNGPSEELIHTEDLLSLNTIDPETQESDSENGDSEDHSDNSEENTDNDDFFSDNCEEHNEQESNAGNPIITSESDSSYTCVNTL